MMEDGVPSKGDEDRLQPSRRLERNDYVEYR